MTSPHRASVAARRRTERVRVLLATDESGLAEAEAVVATLPLCATGRMFVEVPDGAAIGRIAVPPRMTVTWLVRDRGSRRDRADRGALLAGAVAAWASEMLCDDDDVSVWLGGDYRGVAAAHEALVGTAGVDPDAITAPERYRL